jgi:hypothetical protein
MSKNFGPDQFVQFIEFRQKLITDLNNPEWSKNWNALKKA